MRSRSERSAFARKVRRARATVRKHDELFACLRPEQRPLEQKRYERAMATLMEAALKWGSHYPPQNGSTPKPLSQMLKKLEGYSL